MRGRQGSALGGLIIPVCIEGKAEGRYRVVMPGRAVLRSLESKIASLPDGEDEVFEMIASGLSIGKVAEHYGTSRQQLYTWRDRDGQKERRREKWELAMKASASAKAEEGETILDELSERELPPSTADVSLANSRAAYKRWLASVRDRETYGEKAQGPNVVVNIQALHLDALRKMGNMDMFPQAQPALVGTTLEAELIDAE